MSLTVWVYSGLPGHRPRNACCDTEPVDRFPGVFEHLERPDGSQRHPDLAGTASTFSTAPRRTTRSSPSTTSSAFLSPSARRSRSKRVTTLVRLAEQV
jgi:hypothetical protein